MEKEEEEDRKGRLEFFEKWEVHDKFREVQNSIAPMLIPDFLDWTLLNVVSGGSKL